MSDSKIYNDKLNGVGWTFKMPNTIPRTTMHRPGYRFESENASAGRNVLRHLRYRAQTPMRAALCAKAAADDSSDANTGNSAGKQPGRRLPGHTLA
jgi:hypothetical protein